MRECKYVGGGSIIYEGERSDTAMFKAIHWWRLMTLLTMVLIVLSGCAGSGNVPPTPAGQADRGPTLVYLWNFP